MTDLWRARFSALLLLTAIWFAVGDGSAVRAAPGRPCGGSGGVIRVQDAQIPQRGGGTLNAKIFAPDPSIQTSPCPAITMLPGGGAEITSVEWAASRLAASGYVVIITKPRSGGSLVDYNTAAISGIDFLVSNGNPYLSSTDTNAVGAAGWSLGARVLTRTQEEDERISAVVGWDNLAVSEAGDEGSALCTNQTTSLRMPRVPAMGQASDTCNDGRSSDAKKTAFNRWRQFGQPSMQLVFRAANHFWWSATASTANQHDIAHYYTKNWFDRWLKGDLAATGRLLSRTTANYTTVENLLSHTFNSGVFFDGYNCEDMRTACAASAQRVTIGGRVSSPTGQSLRSAQVSLVDANGVRRVTVTSALGFYTFTDVAAAQSYTVVVVSKRYRFAPIEVDVTDNIANLDLVGLE